MCIYIHTYMHTNIRTYKHTYIHCVTSSKVRLRMERRKRPTDSYPFKRTDVCDVGRGNIRSMVICLNSDTYSSEEINYYSIGGSMTILSFNFYKYIYTYTKVLFVAVLRRCSVKNIYIHIHTYICIHYAYYYIFIYKYSSWRSHYTVIRIRSPRPNTKRKYPNTEFISSSVI